MVHVFACNHTEEGVLLVCGESINEERPSVPNLKIPPRPTGPLARISTVMRGLRVPRS